MARMASREVINSLGAFLRRGSALSDDDIRARMKDFDEGRTRTPDSSSEAFRRALVVPSAAATRIHDDGSPKNGGPSVPSVATKLEEEPTAGQGPNSGVRAIKTRRAARAPVLAEKASRHWGLYSIRGSDSPVTGAAIRVNVAAVFAIVFALLGALADALRPRASLVMENLVLRQQLGVLKRARRRPPLRAIDRRRLGRRLSRLVAMGRRARDREAGDRGRVAPPRLRSLLGLEVEARRTTAARAGSHCADRTNGT